MSLSCRTRSTSQPMTASARRGTRAAPRSVLSRRHWVTGRDTAAKGGSGQARGGRGRWCSWGVGRGRAYPGSVLVAGGPPRSSRAGSLPAMKPIQARADRAGGLGCPASLQSPRPSPRTESQHHHGRHLLSAQPSWGAAPGDQYHKCLLGDRLLRSQPRPRGAHTLGCDSDCVPTAPGKGWSLGSTVPAPRLCMGAASILHSLLYQLRPGLARRGWVLLTFPARTRRPESGSSRGIRDLGERDGRSWEYSRVPVTEGPQQG